MSTFHYLKTVIEAYNFYIVFGYYGESLSSVYFRSTKYGLSPKQRALDKDKNGNTFITASVLR